MRKFLLLLLAFVALPAWAANPSVGIHVINTAAISANTYTSASGHTSATSGSSFVVFAGTAVGSGATISDTINGSPSGNTWTTPTPGSGSNPVHESNDGRYMWIFLCKNCAGGTNHEVTVNGDSNPVYAVDFIEIQSASTSSPLDASATAYSTSYPLAVPVTPSVSGDLIIGAGYSAALDNLTISATGAGYTALDSYSGSSDETSMASAYLGSATSGSQDPLMTLSEAGQGFVAVTLAFKPAAATGPPASQMFLGVSLWQRPVSLEAMARRVN